MWSRNPIPVAIDDTPVPSRPIATSTSVSLVARLTAPLRMETALVPNRGPKPRLVSGAGGLRHRSMRQKRAGADPKGLRNPRSEECNCAPRGQCLDHRTMQPTSPDLWHGTTILTVRKGGTVVVGGDGQVSIGQTIIKAN